MAIEGLKNIGPEQAVIRYFDNDSSDDSVKIIREELPQAEVIELKENVGFARAHNRGFKKCETEFVLTHDPDLSLKRKGLMKLLGIMEEDKKIGAIQGKLSRLDGRVDSAGIIKTLALNGRERGASETDEGLYDKRERVWAVTGACGLYRMAALGKVGFFDDDFFAYKEDVDLGWRLNKAGWKVLYEPVVVGTHARTLGKRGVAGWGLDPRVVGERLRSPRTRYSFRNWIWMIWKNASWAEMLKHEVFIDLRLLVFLGLSLTYPPFFKVWAETIRGLPKMARKRMVRGT